MLIYVKGKKCVYLLRGKEVGLAGRLSFTDFWKKKKASGNPDSKRVLHLACCKIIWFSLKFAAIGFCRKLLPFNKEGNKKLKPYSSCELVQSFGMIEIWFHQLLLCIEADG